MDKMNLTPEEKWERATLANNFIFYKVMKNHPDACQHLIEMLLHIQIEKMEIRNEEIIDVDCDAKSIRLDVFVKDTRKMYDVEMQISNTGELPERSRYYQALMDLDTLKAGQEYRELRDSHVIFICLEDIFKNELPISTFENICIEDNKTKLNDRSYKHFFIAPICAKIMEDEEIKSFCEFLISNKAKNVYTSDLNKYVIDAKHNMQWRAQFMTWERQRTYDFNAGKNEGREEGISIGLAQGAHDKAIETARNMLTNSISVEITAKCTGLSVEEIESLKPEILSTK